MSVETHTVTYDGQIITITSNVGTTVEVHRSTALGQDLTDALFEILRTAYTEPICSTCRGTGLVDWAPGQHRDSDEDQQSCPDCTGGAR